MSVGVPLDELRRRIASCRPDVFLITVGDGPAPHAVSVSVRWDDDDLVVGAGRTTATNIAARPSVTLFWPHADDEYSLLVDGTATADDGEARITPASAILHRSVRAATPTGHREGDAPQCITVL